MIWQRWRAEDHRNIRIPLVGDTLCRHPISPRKKLRPVAQKLIELSEDVLFGDVWERPGLSKRERSLATVTALIASGRWNQLNSHLERATKTALPRTRLSSSLRT
ncbi:MAG: carboxymuconolactone decarboxylase family protein [Hyphomicrobiaceae bacterium]